MDFDLSFASSSIDFFFEKEPEAKRTASTGRIRISSISDLSGFISVASDKLVHVSQKDFWRIGQDDDGHFIERLVSDDEGPIEG